MRYRYEIRGIAGNGEAWSTIGTIDVKRGDFPFASDLALRDSFTQLTGGGEPTGGPYTVTKMIIERELDS